MYPDDARDPQLSDQQRLLRMLGLRPPPTSPPVGTAPVGAVGMSPVGTAPIQRRQPWDPSGFVPDWHPYRAEDDGPDNYADEADDYGDEADDYAAEDEEDDYEYAERSSVRGRGGSQGGRDARRKPERRSPARFVLPIVAIIAIGAGAVKLLDGRPHMSLAAQSDRGSRTPTADAPAADAPAASAGKTAFTTFAAYPGQQSRNGGQLAISAVVAADGEQLAAGGADGYPAIWRRGSGTSWSLADGAANGVLAGRPGIETLTAMTHGPAGWLAVGDVVSGTQQHPVVVTSADGATWQAEDGTPAFGTGGLYTYGAAAGQDGYVIVGEQVTGNRVFAAAWRSAGFGTWTRGDNDGLDGRLESSAMFAVAAGPEGLIAVGGHGAGPAVWTSRDGQQWTVTDLPLPTGATSAVLRQVAAHGTRVVAMGNAVTGKETVPFAEVSMDGGASWRGVTLPSPGKQAAVTALAASDAGFVATGQTGQPNDPAAVVWTSADGKTWTAARPVPGPAGAKVQEISGLTPAGGAVTGIGVAATKLGERPVLYMAPVPGPLSLSSSPSPITAVNSPASSQPAIASSRLAAPQPPSDLPAIHEISDMRPDFLVKLLSRRFRVPIR
jgi:hypothetical protein